MLVINLIISFTLYYGGSYIFDSPPAKVATKKQNLAISFPLKGEVLVLKNNDTTGIIKNLSYPLAIDFDDAGNLYIGDKHREQILLYDTEEGILTPFYEVENPVDIRCVKQGVFILSQIKGVKFLDYQGNPVGTYWDTVSFYFPLAMCVDTFSERLLVVDKKASKPWIRIRRFDYYGSIEELIWEKKDAISYGISYFHNNCSIYFPDALWGKLLKYSLCGGTIDSFGYFGSDTGAFKSPIDIKIREDLNPQKLYLVNYGNSRIDLYYFQQVNVEEVEKFKVASPLIVSKNITKGFLKLSFYTDVDEDFALSIISPSGRLIKSLERGKGKRGWNKREYFLNLPSGTYFLVFEKNNTTISKKILEVGK